MFPSDFGMTNNAKKMRAKVRLFIRQRGACALCGGTMHLHPEDVRKEPHYAATRDHIKRVRDGGTSRADNIRLVHKFCNTARN